MAADDAPVRFAVGESYVQLTMDQAGEKAQKVISEKQEELKALENQLGTTLDTMSALKVQLYAKFGKSINLEADDD